jgi:hypothetical protein
MPVRFTCRRQVDVHTAELAKQVSDQSAEAPGVRWEGLRPAPSFRAKLTNLRRDFLVDGVADRFRS